MAKKSVIVELRVPRNLSSEVQLSLASSEIKLSGFEIDLTYRPIPASAVPNHELGLDLLNQELVVIRGALEEGQEELLEREPMVVAVWSDARIEPFDGTTYVSPEDLAF